MAEDDTVQRARIQGKEYALDVSSITLDEEEECKRIIGIHLAKALRELGPDDPSVRRAFCWLMMHRENPEVTAESLGSLTLGDVELVGDEEEVVLPPSSESGSSAESEPSGPSSSAVSDVSRVIALPSTGNQPSATGSVSDRATSAS